MIINNKIRIILRFLFFTILFIPVFTSGQSTQVRGVITDAQNGDPLPFVNVVIEGRSSGTTTDFDGQYLLQSVEPFAKIRITFLGYRPELRDVQPGKMQTINFKLQQDVKQLKEVTVKAEKRRYRNKDNPAVELIRRVIDHKKENRKSDLSAYQFEKYEKVEFALSNISQKFKNKRYLKKFQFIFNNTDTTKLSGREILPMYLKETLSDFYYRKDPKGSKEIVKGSKNVNFERYFDNEGIGTFMKYLYQDIDIYSNSFPILTNPFISPIADAAPVFYRYYIMDTLLIDSTKCIRLAFFPRNKADFLFQGDLYIIFDSTYAVKKLNMTVNPDINLNFVKEMKIDQEFTAVLPGEWLLSKEEIDMDFGVSKNGMGLFGQRSQTFRNYLLNAPLANSFYSGEEVEIPDSAKTRTEAYWNEARHVQLSKSEQGVYNMVDSIQKIPAFRHAMNLMILLFAGYKDFGPFEIGPVNTFYSFTPIEGIRIRFGGRTTRALSPRWNFETYGAYGFRDMKWKYYFGTTYSLGKKSFNEFPMHTIKASYQEETKIPGQELQFVQEDNVLLSIKRGENNKWLYNRIFNLVYLREFANHTSYSVGLKRWEQTPTGTLIFNATDYSHAPAYNVPHITTSEVIVELRFAPHEQFYQGKNYRIPMQNEFPVYQFRFTGGFKGLMEGEYNYQNIQFNVLKRFFIPPLGYTDILFEAGKIFGKVPYPLLDVHRANQTYSYQLLSYNLMNFLEFVSDQYVSLNVDHFFNGFFFNKIPLFKKLKWREVISAKVLYGTVSDGNNPDKTPGLFKFPVNTDGVPLTYTLEKKPYIEASVGVANILKLFRVDIIKRLSYLDHPTVSEFGVRGRFKLDF